MSDFELVSPGDPIPVFQSRESDLRVMRLIEGEDLEYTKSLEAAWKIVNWLYAKRSFNERRLFWQAVQESASAEFKPDIGIRYVVAYPDVLHLAGDRLPFYLCKAALNLFEAPHGVPG